jgi:hypothetical protein
VLRAGALAVTKALGSQRVRILVRRWARSSSQRRTARLQGFAPQPPQPGAATSHAGAAHHEPSGHSFAHRALSQEMCPAFRSELCFASRLSMAHARSIALPLLGPTPAVPLKMPSNSPMGTTCRSSSGENRAFPTLTTSPHTGTQLHSHARGSESPDSAVLLSHCLDRGDPRL